MTEHRTWRLVAGLTLGVSVLFGTGDGDAEQRLSKDQKTYLGWMDNKSTDSFKTCEGSVIKIGNGKVEETKDKCRKKSPDVPTGVINPFDRVMRDIFRW